MYILSPFDQLSRFSFFSFFSFFDFFDFFAVSVGFLIRSLRSMENVNILPSTVYVK